MKIDDVYISKAEIDLLNFLKIKRRADEIAIRTNRTTGAIRNMLSTLYFKRLVEKKRYCREVYYWTPVQILVKLEKLA